MRISAALAAIALVAAVSACSSGGEGNSAWYKRGWSAAQSLGGRYVGNYGADNQLQAAHGAPGGSYGHVFDEVARVGWCRAYVRSDRHISMARSRTGVDPLFEVETPIVNDFERAEVGAWSREWVPPRRADSGRESPAIRTLPPALA